MSGGEATETELFALLVLKADESPIGSWWGAKMDKVPMSTGEAYRAIRQSGGVSSMRRYMLLTSQRLAFVTERGWLSKMRHLNEVYDLEQIAGVSVVRRGTSRPTGITLGVRMGSGTVERIFTLPQGWGQKNWDPLNLQSVVERTIRAHLDEMETMRIEARVQYVLDFSFLKSRMESGGITVSTIKCPSCGSPLKLPETGNQTKCDSCGSPVWAQDIFANLKGLLAGLDLAPPARGVRKEGS